MNRRRKLLGAVCVLLTGVTFLCAPWQADQKSQVERQFHADLEELTQTAELVLAGQEAEAPSGWRNVSRFDDVVCFDYGNRLVGFQGMSMEGAVPDGEGWLWEENPGDNRCYVEPLAPCWYYFEMKF